MLVQGKVILGVRCCNNDISKSEREYQLSVMNISNTGVDAGSIGLCQFDLNTRELISETLVGNNTGSNGEIESTADYGIMPVITLNKNIQITGGDGLTPDTAYTYTFTNN